MRFSCCLKSGLLPSYPLLAAVPLSGRLLGNCNFQQSIAQRGHFPLSSFHTSTDRAKFHCLPFHPCFLCTKKVKSLLLPRGKKVLFSVGDMYQPLLGIRMLDDTRDEKHLIKIAGILKTLVFNPMDLKFRVGKSNLS